MRRRRRREDPEELCSGPGKLTEALGVGLGDNGASLAEPPFEVLARRRRLARVAVAAGPRIGITKAVENPWRFCAAGSRFVSRPWPADRAGLAAAGRSAG